MSALAGLPRSWLGMDLPGYRPTPELATYAGYPLDSLPPVLRDLGDEFGWLRDRPPVGPPLDDPKAMPSRRPTAENLRDLLAGVPVEPPPSFTTFVGTPALHQRIRSATACYLDLADRAVPVEGGGHLIHFLSDQQWVLHWLLFAAGGAEAVVVTPDPFGFASEEAPGEFDPNAAEAFVCADSFAEFVYRFWIENEIWFAIDEGRALDDEQRAYAERHARDT